MITSNWFKNTRWCVYCKQHKPVAGCRQVRPGTFKCADCLKVKEKEKA